MSKTAGLAALAIALTLTTHVKAGGPPPICMVVDRIVWEPDEKAPTRIQVWGTFIFCKDNRSFGSPTSGYLYYTAEEGKEDACRQEWAKLQKLAQDKHIVALGMCGIPKVDGHFRSATEKPSSPAIFPLEKKIELFTNGDGYAREFPGAKKLLEKAVLQAPKQ